MKNRILLENRYLPGHLERAIVAFVDDHTKHRNDERLNNVKLAVVYAGGGTGILKQRENIKEPTMRQRCLQHHKQFTSSIAQPHQTQTAVTSDSH